LVLDHDTIEETKGAAAGLVESAAAQQGARLGIAPIDGDVTDLAVERICAALSRCINVDELRDIVDKAIAIRGYHRQRGASLRIQNQAAEIRIQAERRIGELLRNDPEIRPGRKGTSGGTIPRTLKSLKISKNQSSMWQRLAVLDLETVKARIALATDNGLEATTYRVLNEAKVVAKAAELAKRDEAAAPTPAPRSADASEEALREMARAAFEGPRHAFTDELPDDATTAFLRAEAVRFIADLDTFEASRLKRIALEQPSTP
jgi:hypothetical protein